MKRNMKYKGKSKGKGNKGENEVEKTLPMVVVLKYKRILDSNSEVKKKVRLITRNNVDLETYLVDIMDVLWGILGVLERAFLTEEVGAEE